MRLIFRSNLDADLARNAATFKPQAAKAVRARATSGNREAKRFAKRSAGAHGKHYPNAISAEAITPLMWEYGPDAQMPQGDMSFERGSRNQPPHNDLARSADPLTMQLGQDLDEILDRLFW